MPRVIYSNGARIAGGGIGNTSYQAVSGLHRHRILERLICGSAKPTEIPRNKIRSLGVASRVFRKLAVYDPQNRLDYAYRILYDRWASRELTACEVFHGWSGYSLDTLRRAKGNGAITVLDRALAHPIYLDRLLREEHQKFGVPYPKMRVVPLIKQEISEVDFVCIPSDFVRETFRTEGVPDTKLIQIPFGVDCARFQPHPRPAGEGFRALFVGQVSIRKGAHTLLEAWKMLGWQNAELWLAGRVDLPTSLLEPYQDLPGVRFLGHVASIPQVFQRADVFVFPSLAEGSALVTYEAMASGLPVVVTFNAGSITKDGEDGLIIPARNPVAIAESLERLRVDDHLRKKMGTAARNKVEKFTWKRYGDRVAETLQQVFVMNKTETASLG